MTNFERAMMACAAAGVLATAGFHVGRRGMIAEPTFSAVAHERAADRAALGVQGIGGTVKVDTGTITTMVTGGSAYGGTGGTFTSGNGAVGTTISTGGAGIVRINGVTGALLTQPTGVWKGSVRVPVPKGSNCVTMMQDGSVISYTCY